MRVDVEFAGDRVEEAERAELLATLLRREGLDLAPPPLMARPRGGAVPLSYAQARLWFLDQLGLVGSAYNTPAALRLEGPLDVGALERSFGEVVRRHEALRTRFEVLDGQGAQMIDPPGEFCLALEDLSRLGSEEQEAEVVRLAREHGARHFDLVTGPLFAAKLLRLGDGEHVVLVNMHHIVSDGWSVGVLIREIGLLYAAFRKGRPSPLAELPIQYADYALWQRAWLQGAALAQQVGYWRERLAGAPAALELPTDQARPAVASHAGERVPFRLSGDLSSRLVEFSRREEVTLYMVLLAAFQVLLGRYSGQDDIVVGSPIAGRQRQELEGLIGFFVNPLVMRTNLSGDPSFRELLGRVKEVCLGAYAHQDLPFEKLVEELQPVRDLSRQPVFQVVFALQNMPTEALALPGLTLSPAGVEQVTSKYDLTMFVHETGGGLQGSVDYAAELFERGTIQRLTGHFRMLLEGVVADPTRRLSDLDLLTDAERCQLVGGWNDTAASYPQKQCLHELFGEQAARTPDAVALVHEDGRLSYAELEARSNQLAHHLRGLGVGPEIVVGLCVERSPEMVVGLLAILKAGGAYLPLDPDYPAERLAYMLADARAPVLLTQSGLLAQLPQHDATVVRLDADWEDVARHPQTAPPSSVRPSHLAYVIYTSGSTGKPKGVMVPHCGIVNRLWWMQDAYGLTPADRILQKTPFSFDVSVWEFFWPLIFGAGLVIARPGGHRDPAYICDVVAREGVTIMHFVPSMLNAFLESDRRGDCASLRDVFCSGEALTVATQDRFMAQLPSRLHNLYGPTEASVDVSAWQCACVPGSTQVPIGRPISNISLYVLDDGLGPVPIGVSGELYIGGVGLARGYLGRAGLTAERFVPSPFVAGERLYRTGDLARWRADGKLEYLGRIDHQVKIRGHRIELGEIEATLGRHEGIDHAVVVAREDAPDEKRLVAYVVGLGCGAPEASALRSHLRQSLPEYMVPSAFVVLEALPLTPSGKVDRRALPAPEGRAEAGAYVAPRTPLEEKLAGIWAAILKVDTVGIEDNFFALGGHSLLAMRLVAQLRDVFEIELPLRALFEAPAISEMADRIEHLIAHRLDRPAPAAAKLPVITPDSENRHEPFPLNDIQEAYWIGRGQGFVLGNVAAYSYVEFDGVGVNVQKLEAVWQKLIERHDMLRAIVLPDGSQRILAQAPAYRFPIRDLRQESQDAAELELLATRKRLSHQVLPTDRWPLFTIEVSLLPGERARIHFGIDIIICDAWSRVILLRDLALLYHDLDAALPPLVLSFRDYVEAERKLRDSEHYRIAWDYWSSRFGDMPPAPTLPLLTKPESIAQPRFGQLRGHLKKIGWRRIKAHAAEMGLTPTAVLLSVYADVLALFTGDDRFTLNLTVFNRLPLHEQVDDIVGDFTSLIPLAVDHGGPAPFLARAQRIQQQLWADLDHRLMSGVRIMRERARDPVMRRSGMLPVVFTSTLGMQNAKGDEQTDLLGEFVVSSTQTPQVWLDLQVGELAGELVHMWSHVDGLLPEGMIEAMFETFRSELGELALDAGHWSRQRPGGLPQTQLEQRQRANATDGPLSDQRLEDLFLAQVAARPDALAVIAADKAISYRELERRSLAIARRVTDAGGRSPGPVAVVMEKGWEQIVAVLGVLRAGAAYVPLDPALPAERLHHLVAHCGIGIALTQAKHEEEVAWPTEVTRILVDREPPASPAEKLELPAGSPDNLAYVIYTSGSTGMPKGVMISHRGAVNTILEVNRMCSVSERDRIFSVSSLSFDLSVYDIFGMLAAGAAIVLPEPSPRPEPARWVDLITKSRVTLWNSVPALLELLLEHAAAAGARPNLRLAMLSGDWIPVSLPDRLRSLAKDADVLAMGGATEASIWSNYKWVDRSDTQWTSIPYGRPLANQKLHVLDRLLQPCPVWTPGELYIGGTGLALGYWRDDKRTEESFIVHPETGERLYRTGDFGRYLPDGDIEFLGRQDTQVKISGQRIELGEIEHALQQHPDLSGCVVTVSGEKHGQKKLLAYVVAKPDHTVDTETIREFLARKLPRHMVPGQFVSLERLPLTPNGKIDRRALPAQQQISGNAGDEGAITQTQRTLSEIWGEVLKVEPIGVHDDFFLRGGDSLLAMKVAVRIREKFQFTVSTAAMFDHPTIAELSRFLDLGIERRAETVQEGIGVFPAKIPAIDIISDPHEREGFKGRETGIRCFAEPDDLIKFAAPQLGEELEINGVRRNSRHFARGKISLESFSSFMSLLRRRSINGSRKYGYPSAGGLYPVQAYVHIRDGGAETGVEGLRDGTYYYSPAENGLHPISPGAQLDRTIHALLNRPVSDQASFTLLLIAELRAIVPIYGVEGLRMACLEAGMMSQLLEEAARTNGIGICHVGSIAFDTCKAIFDLDESHLLLHTMMGGRLAPYTDADGWSFVDESIVEQPDAVELLHARPEGPLALSYAQERLWFLEQLGLAGSAYNVPAALRLSGTLDALALERSFAEVVRRHEVLRTRFEVLDGQGMQVIDAAGEFVLALEDLSGLGTEEREARVEALARADAVGRFDLATGPLLRARLLRLGDGEHVVLVNMHHIVSDGWSVGVLIREIGSLYAAFREGRVSPLAELPVQYADYALWQRGWLQGAALARQVEYWREQLAGAPAALELPTDRARPAVASHAGAMVGVALPLDLSSRLAELSRRAGVTLYMVLLAAFQVLLGRYSGQDDIVVGSPIAGRRRQELEGLIGFFVNTLVMRTDLSGDPVFRDLLGRVKEMCLGAYAHQDLPFEKLVEELQPVRDLSRQPIFQVSFVLQNVPMDALELPGLRLSQVAGAQVTSKFDLTLSLHETPSGLRGSVEYATDLFDATTMERFVGHFERLLERIVADPEQRLSQLSQLTDAERRQLVEEWNDTAVSYPQEQCLHELFGAHAARTPDTVALVHEDRNLSYAELEAQSNQLAHHLRSLGVGPESVVGLCVERSPEMVVGLLGILKAGGAYLPLEPGYPAERLAYMLGDARASVLLTQARLLAQLPPHDARVVRLDADWDEIARQPQTAPPNTARPANLAYVIYTSGSTGKPKGVMVGHKGVVNYVSYAARTYVAATRYGSIVSTSLSFDATVTSLFVPLISGQPVCLLPEVASIEALDAMLPRRSAFRLLKLTPAHLEALWSVAPAIRYSGEDYTVVIGGEALSAAMTRAWRERAPKAQLINEYGPTETVVGCSVYEIDAATPWTGPIPIGRPISNAQVYVLDGLLAAVPIGVAGELYIGGAGLARGYLGRAGLTAERFVPSPFLAAERLYRSGDLARWRADGALEYLGRIDTQVKLRGYRIELGEIEATLVRHDDIEQAVVVAREDAPGEKRLVAYMVGRAGAALETSTLRAHLRQSLPDYMVPSAFVTLAALPLTPNGKVDRRALPAPEGRPEVGAYVGPRTPVEEALCLIWRHVLKLDRVGVTDNFFALGGHSLMATRVVARLRDVLEIELPLRAMFEAPTVRELAEHIENAQREGLDLVLAPLQIQPRDGVLALSYAQERLWFLDQLDVGAGAYNMPTALRLEGELDVESLERSLAEVVRRHEVLRMRFGVVEGQGLQVIDAAGEFALAVEDLSGLGTEEREARVEALARADAVGRFDLATGPLLRARLLRLGNGEHVVLVNMHHIVSDGWSVGVLVREIGALYAAFREGRASPLAELPVQYADYALWQRGWLQGAALARQVGYWRERLAGAPAALEFPSDRARPAVASHAGATVGFALSLELASRLAELSRREGVTLYMVLLAAFQVLLGRYSGQDDIVVGSPIAGRRRQELEGLIGFFVNILVMRTDLSGDPVFRDLLGRVKEMCLGAYAHQDLPFEKLVEELQPVRDLSRQPIFQVSFVLQNVPMEALELPGLRLRRVGGASVTSKFDLTMLVRETPAGLQGHVEYATELFDRATIERLARHFGRLLEGIVADPGRRLSTLELLTDAERGQLVEGWNDTAVSYPQEQCLHELFGEQAARMPDAVALVHEDRRLSYGELEARSNQLAHHLRDLGVGPETVVGLCVERSPEMVVGLLGILKAGGAYLPLDPGYPAERLAYMLADARAPVLLTQPSVLGQLPEHDAQVVLLDADWSAFARHPNTAPPNTAHPANLAYVMYTSGSTGRPKGVMITHDCVGRLLAATQAWFEFGPGDVWTLFHSYAFDFSVWEMWGALAYGGRVVVVPFAVSRAPDAFYDLLCREGVTVLNQTPSAFNGLSQASMMSAQATKLRLVIFGGEALSLPNLRAWFDRHGDAQPRLVNMYGITETTVHVTYRPIRQADLAAELGSVIGGPIPDLQVHVLDQHQRLVPVGVNGELYVGGAGVARGYLGRAGLTAERFVPSPFGDGERLYRSGDLARRRGDGELEYLGRIDSQVKIRGYRIELGEIEAALARHDGVDRAVVMAREDAPGEKRLVAYVIGRDGATPEPNGLRAHLRQSLPEYMIPAAFVTLAALPLTPNGKVDQRALPIPEGRREAGAYAAPRNEMEEILADIWATILKLDRVGVHDNFFEIGGHSLLAMQLILRVRSVFGVDLALRVLFEAAPTIAEMAAQIRLSRAAGQGFESHPAWLRAQNKSTDFSCIIPVQTGSELLSLFCIHPIGGGILCYRELARHLGPDHTVYGIKALGLHGERDPLTSIEAMAQHHLERLLEVQTSGPFFLVGWSAGGLVAIEIARRLKERNQEVGLLGLIDTSPPFSSGKWRGYDVERAEWINFLSIMEIPFDPKISSRRHAFWKRSEAEKQEIVLAAAKTHGVLPSGLTIEEFATMVKVFQANLFALQQYEASVYPGRIVLFQGAATPGRSAASALDLAFRFWDRHAAAGCELVKVPGDHMSIMAPPAVGVIADRVRQAILDSAHKADLTPEGAVE